MVVMPLLMLFCCCVVARVVAVVVVVVFYYYYYHRHHHDPYHHWWLLHPILSAQDRPPCPGLHGLVPHGPREPHCSTQDGVGGTVQHARMYAGRLANHMQ